MKKYFLNVAKMFLVGATLAVVGCTDYDEDIRDLNERIDKEILNDEIAPLKVKLDETVANLNASTESLQKLIDANKADIAALQQVDADLNAAINGINTEIGNINTELGNTNDRIDDVNNRVDDVNDKVDNVNSTLLDKINNLETNLTAADTELANKIAAANEAISALETSLANEVATLNGSISDLQGQIDDVNSDLDKVRQDMENGDAALNDKYTQLAEKHAQDIVDLQEKLANEIATLKSALEGKIDALRQDMEKKVEDAKTELTNKLNSAVETLNNKDADLQNQINTVSSNLATLSETVANNYNELKGDIAALETKLLAQIQTNKRAIETNASSITKLQGELAELNTTVNNLSDKVVGIEQDILKHQEEFAQYKVVVAGQIASLEAKNAALELRIEAIESLIPEMQAQIEENNSLAQENAAEIAKNAALQQQFQTAVNATIDQLTAADAAFTTALATLGDDVAALSSELVELQVEFTSFQEEIRDQVADNLKAIDALEALIGEYATKHATDVAIITAQQQAQSAVLSALQAQLQQELADREAADKANNAASIARDQALQAQIDGIGGRVDVLENNVTALQSSVNAIDTKIDNIKTSLENAINSVNTTVWENYSTLSGSIKDLELSLKDEVTTLENSISSLKSSLELADQNLQSAIDAANNRISTLEGDVNKVKVDVDALLSQVQSIVYVPTHADGKATINYAKIGQSIIETRSSMTFQVYPADCAKAIASLANGESEGNLKFLMQGVQLSRSESGAALDIVNATATEDGRLTITFDARNLTDDFYNKANNVSWSAALYLNNAKNANGNVVNNISTEYINLYPASTATEIKVGIYNTKDEEITDNGQFTVVGGHGDIEFGYNSTKTEVVLPGHYVGYNVDGQVLNTNEMRELGYDITVTPGDHGFKIPEDNGGKAENFDVTLNDAGEENNYGGNEQYASVKLNNVSAENVGDIMIYRYLYEVAGTTVGAYATIYIGPEVSEITFNPVTIYWDYNLDAVAGNSWGMINRQGTARNIALTIDEEKTENLPEDIDLAQFFQNLKKMSYGTTPESMVELTTAEFTPILHSNSLFIANFGDLGHRFDTNGFLEWNKTYTVKASYSNGSNTVNATLEVTTVAPNHDLVALDLGEVEYTIAKDFVIDANNEVKASINGIAETLNAQYAYEGAEVHGLGTFAGEENYNAFLTEVFDTNAPTFVKTEYFDGNDTLIKTNTGSEWRSKLAIANDATDGWYAAANYTYETPGLYNETQTVVYKKLVTLWYGQQVELTRTVKFNLPTYDYAHTTHYVYDGGNRYYSKAQGEYNPSIEATNVSAFNVADIKLLNAFYVTDGSKNLTEEEIAAAGLVREFSLVGTFDGITLTNNVLSYQGKTPEVPVTATLAIANSNNTMIVLPTAFDGDGAYSDYVVKKYDPLMSLTTDDENGYVYVPVGDELSYNVKVLKFFNLFENRDGKKGLVDLIDNEGNWTVGDDNNGLAMNVTGQSLYGLNTNYSGVTIPADYTNIISWQKNDQEGVLTFDNTNQIDLANPIVIPVTFAVDYTWGYYDATVKVVFYNPNNGKPSF